MNILVVEDDPTSAAVLQKTVENLGHGVTVAPNGRAAWDLLDDPSRFFDLVYVDLNLPEVDGFELIRRIRSSSILSSLDIVVCTASRDTPSFRRAVDLGVHDYVLKPATPARISRQITAIEQRKNPAVTR
jgi:CheY-like chemotaxis protein